MTGTLDRLPRLAGLLVLALAIAHLARLAVQATGARFFTDECFHAYVAEWIGRRGRLPDRLPELYSGFYYYYPPLFHLVGALWGGVLGLAALKYLNLLLTALMLLVLGTGLGAGLPAAARRWAVLLCIANHWLSLHALRFYPEMLMALLVTAAVLFLARFWAGGRVRDAVMVGVATGLALLTKPTGLIALPLLLALAAADRATSRPPRRAMGLLLATGVALLVAAPMLVRNQILFGSPVYPLLAPDLEPRLYRLTLERFDPPALRFYRRASEAFGPWLLGFFAAGLIAVVRRRRLDFAGGGLIVCGVLVVAAPLLPLDDPRHLVPLLPPIALLGGVVVDSWIGRRGAVRLAVEGVLVIAATLHVARLPEYRQPLNLPPRLAEAYAAVREHAPEGATVLSLWTYDTFFHARRPATWPIPWGQPVHPIEPFEETDPQRFLASLERYRIEFLLVPLGEAPETFDGANYPRTFVRCVSQLVESGALRVVWSSRVLALVARVDGR